MKNRKRFARILSVMLCSLMAATAISGCGNGSSESSTPASTGSESTPASSASDKGPLYIEGSEGVTLTYWIPIDSTAAQHYETLAEHPYFQWLKEETGVNVEFIHPSYEQMEQQMNLMIASKKYYDMLYTPDYPGGPQAGIDEGCFIDINPYLDEYMPDYKAALDCSDGSFASWEWGKEKELYDLLPQDSFRRYNTTKSGALYGVTQIWSQSYLLEVGPVIRKDWLDEAGLAVPETLDELEVVLEAFKARGDNVIPMNLGNYGYNGGDGSIVSAFDVYPNFWTMSDNATKVAPHAYTQDSFKDYLTLMNRWYSKGYIDPDFMNRDGDSVLSMFLDDRLGVYFDTWSTPDQLKSYYTGADPDFEVVAMTLPRKTKDQQLHWCNHYMSVPTNNTVITTSCEHPEIAAAWLNTGFTKEGILRATYGIEGETYEIRDGAPYYTADFINSEDQNYLWNCVLFPNSTGYASLRASFLRTAADQENEVSPTAQAQMIWQENADWDSVWTFVTFSDDGWGQFDTAYNDAATYADPMVLKFIIGEESLDKFDEFKATCKRLGMDKAQELAQAALDNMTE